MGDGQTGREAGEPGEACRVDGDNGKRALRYAFPRTVPVLVGYLFLGAAYGILMKVNGFGIWWSLSMSVFVFAGSLQYVGITFLASAANPVYVFFMSLMINARHLFYGVSMLDRYRDIGKEKPYLIFALTDETFSILCNQELPHGIPRRLVYFFVSLLDHFYWIAGTVIGSFAGGFITFDTAGLDFALTALFVVIFVDQWSVREGRKPALMGLAASAVCLKIFGPDAFIIPAMLLILLLVTLSFYRGRRKNLE